MGYDLEKALKGAPGPGLTPQKVTVRGKTKAFQAIRYKGTGVQKKPAQQKPAQQASEVYARVESKLKGMKDALENEKRSKNPSNIEEKEQEIKRLEERFSKIPKPKGEAPEGEGEYEPVIVHEGKVIHAGKGYSQEHFKKQYGKHPEVGMDAPEQGGAKELKRIEEEKGKAGAEEIKRFETKQKEEGTHPSEQQKAEWKAKKEATSTHQKKLMGEFEGEGKRQTKAETSEHPKNVGDFATVGGKKLHIKATGEDGFTGYDENGNRHQVKWDQLKDYGEEKEEEPKNYGKEAEPQTREIRGGDRSVTVGRKVVYESPQKAEAAKEPYKAKKKGFFQRFREGK